MTYRVIWRFPAVQQLQAIEQAAVDPASVRQAVTFMEYALRRSPKDFGEERSRTVRLWYWDVLGLLYTVDDDRQEVEILMVGPARRR